MCGIMDLRHEVIKKAAFCQRLPGSRADDGDLLPGKSTQVPALLSHFFLKKPDSVWTRKDQPGKTGNLRQGLLCGHGLKKAQIHRLRSLLPKRHTEPCRKAVRSCHGHTGAGKRPAGLLLRCALRQSIRLRKRHRRKMQGGRFPDHNDRRRL